MMPYWSLGYHQCKYGYVNLGAVEDVRSNFSASNIPLDVVWMDIDYMAHWKVG
jgi:alpha-glucosidase (family GH31 glycosyl hydrolase)